MEIEVAKMYLISFQRVCKVIVAVRRPTDIFIARFGTVSVFAGQTDSAGLESISRANMLCGVINGATQTSETVLCAEPICAQYVSLETESPRFEFAEVFVNDCGYRSCTCQ